MRKQALLTILLASASLFTIGCVNKDNAIITDQPDNTLIEEKSQTTQADSVTTMKKIFESGKPTTCYFTLPTEDGNVFDGTLYVDGKNMKYSINGFIEGNSIENRFLLKDGYSYSRSSMDPGKGYKMKENDTSDEYEEVGPEEQDMETKFTCKNGVESAEFEIPGDITFIEFEENYDNSNI